MATTSQQQACLLPLLLVIACRAESDHVTFRLQARAFANSEWSEPVNVGAPVNSSANEQSGTLSRDGLSLYFTSDRAGGFGALDIWVSLRPSTESPWGTPVNLGPVINTTSNDFAPNLSIDGHLLFFSSNRSGGHGGNDIYVSHRADPRDEFGWGPAVNLGPDVNTPTAENAPMYLQSAEEGAANLYFNRGVLALGQADIYYAPVTRDGQTRGPAVLVTELSDPTANDAAPSVRADGREMFFWSTRTGGLGGQDLWVSIR